MPNFPGPVPKTESEHLRFLKGLSSLMVSFALGWARRHPGTSFSQALSDKTFFVNLGAWHRGELYDHPDVGDEASPVWRSFLSDGDALSSRADAEAAILDRLPSDIEYFRPRVDRDLADLHDPVRGLAARSGCLWTFANPSRLSLPDSEGAPNTLEFHMANHRYPGSFLKDPTGIRQELRALSRRAADLGFQAIGTRSWLNDLPAWTACFPPAWSQRREPRDEEAVGGHLGCWGQAITARQTLSSHADDYLRTHGRFEFAMRTSWMTVEEGLSL